MQRKTFNAEAQIMSSITVNSLKVAERQEGNHEQLTDSAVRLLRNHVQATMGRVMGSDASRIRSRSQIWSTSMYLGPPSLWITINPCDLHDPVAQVFAGENIEMDNFVASMGPDVNTRAKNISEDPYAAAKFFHYIIHTMTTTLFGIETTPYKVKSSEGVFGRVRAYFGSVESQGRGSLHLHLLLWLANTPTSDEMTHLLKSEDFRNRIRAFIKQNLRAHVPGLETRDRIKMIPNETDIAYCRPPHPDSADYASQCKDLEKRVARSKQLHKCEIRRCLVVDPKTNNLRCKRKAPFEVSDNDYINEDGQWGMKRTYKYMNGFVRAIAVNGRCNNDGKLLTNGAETRNVSFYIFKYSLKVQGRNFNTSAIFAKTLAYHKIHSEYLESLQERQRLFLFCVCHAINREQELSAPMVMSYLMGWGDMYKSHRYTPVYWTSFVGQLLEAFPLLKSERVPVNPSQLEDTVQGSSNEQIEAEQNGEDKINGEEMVTLDVNDEGRIFAKSQMTDYCCRGEELESYNVLQFFVDTYEEDKGKAKPKVSTDATSREDEDTLRRPGRKPNGRIPYLPSHPNAKTKTRVMRTTGHHTLPNIVGRFFARRDDSSKYDYYCSSMLMLLKPWRELKTDLKKNNETWEHTFESFTATCSKRELDIMSDIQYFYECESSAHRKQAEEIDEESFAQLRRENGDVDDGHDAEEDIPNVQYSEAGLVALIASQKPEREIRPGLHAVAIARSAKVFDGSSQSWALSDNIATTGTSENIVKLQSWKEQMSGFVRSQNEVVLPTAQGGHGSVSELTEYVNPGHNNQQLPDIASMDRGEEVEAALEQLDPTELKEDQWRAYDIITWHLEQTLAGHNPPPLRMVLYGEGGTGKSRVIQTVTQYFEQRQAKHWLLKGAYTGVAASLIDGKTLHVIGNISVNRAGATTMSEESKRKLQDLWNHYTYLIVDEYSMIAKTFLARLSRNISIGKQKEGEAPSDSSFGGINVVLCGDQHQFPPVATSQSEALYRPIDLANDSIDEQVGRTIYEEFDVVVILKEQMRVVDHTWRDFLVHLRHGMVEERHLKMLRTLVLGDITCLPTDFSKGPWNDASLVTPRHAVREQWNEEALRKHCKNAGSRLYVCKSSNMIQKRSLTLMEKYVLALHLGKRKSRKTLPDVVELAVGMKVLVTRNIETDLDITNGARGEIVDIVLDPREPTPEDGTEIVHLQYLPLYVLVQMGRTRAERLEGLEANVIPIEPTAQTVRLTLRQGKKVITRTVKRRQFSMTAAYAFTDYRSQGQTIPYVIVDIAKPPTGKLNLFNLYVALSRSSGRDTIRLLRDFDQQTLMAGHKPVRPGSK